MKPSNTPLKSRRSSALRGLCIGLFSSGLMLCAVAAAHDYDYVYSSEFGSYGSGNGQFIGPTFNLNFVAVDPSNHNILVEDGGNNRVQIFNASGTYLRQFGGQGSGNGQFNGILGVAVDPASHEIVVADGNNRIQIFNSSGSYVRQFGSAGSGNGQFDEPGGVSIDPVSRNIVIADLNNHRVQIFSSSGVYLGQFGSYGSGDGQFVYALYLTIDPNTHEILVGDEINNNVQIFSSTGTYLHQFGSFGSGNGQFNNAPGAIAIDAVTGNIVVEDYFNSRIEVFDSNGIYLSQFGSAGNGNGQFNADNGPTGLDIDQSTHKVVVLDRGNSRAEIFAPSTSPPTPSCGPTQVSLSIAPLRATLGQDTFFSAQASITAPFTGTVSFEVDGATNACTASMVDVYASCLHPLLLGTHSVVAKYSGDGRNPAGCSAAQSVTVVAGGGQLPTNIACNVTPDPPVQGQPITMACSVNDGDQPHAFGAAYESDTTLPAGFVTLSEGPDTVAYTPVFNGRSAYSTVLAGGNHTLTLTYSGDDANATSAVDLPLMVTIPSDDIFYSGFEGSAN